MLWSQVRSVRPKKLEHDQSEGRAIGTGFARAPRHDPRGREPGRSSDQIGRCGDRLVIDAARTDGDVNDRVLESRRQLETQIRKTLRPAMESAERALDRARPTQAAGADAVALEIRRLVESREAVLASCRVQDAA